MPHDSHEWVGNSGIEIPIPVLQFPQHSSAEQLSNWFLNSRADVSFFHRSESRWNSRDSLRLGRERIIRLGWAGIHSILGCPFLCGWPRWQECVMWTNFGGRGHACVLIELLGPLFLFSRKLLVSNFPLREVLRVCMFPGIS